MATPSDMDTPMYMLLNLGVGGIAGTASGSESMEIDYVRAYASDASLANVSVAQFVSESNLLNGTPATGAKVLAIRVALGRVR